MLLAVVLVACGSRSASVASSTITPDDAVAEPSSPTTASTPVAPTDPTTSTTSIVPTGSSAPAAEVRVVVPTVRESYPHDTAAFTQGLVFTPDALFESTGGYGESSLREVDLVTGSVRRELHLPGDLFGEGLAMVGDRLIQLTWQAGRAFVYDSQTFEVVEELAYEDEGWGLCHDGEALWMSNGSATLTRRDPVTFEELGAVEVTRSGQRVERLNELECVDGMIYANVWLTDEIVVVDPVTGEVVLVVDGSGLLAPEAREGLSDEAVLNGIAHDVSDDTLLLTGKLWPAVIRVENPRA